MKEVHVVLKLIPWKRRPEEDEEVTGAVDQANHSTTVEERFLFDHMHDQEANVAGNIRNEVCSKIGLISQISPEMRFVSKYP